MTNDFRAADYIYKTVSFRYCGKEFSFGLSHGLFSSNSVDRGSALLLKTLADDSTTITAPPESIVDIGCGTGVLGICFAARYPDSRVTMTDRDALALAVTEENCKRNRIRNASLRRSLMFHGLRDCSYDLVVSNLPAKAGAPVLEEFFRHAVRVLTPDGICAVVIVLPLADDAVGWIDGAGGRVLREERTSGHAVFHFTAAHHRDRSSDAADEPARGSRNSRERSPEQHDSEAFPSSPTVPETFIRTGTRIKLGKRQLEMDTVYALPEFDTPAYSTQNIIQTLDLPGIRGSLLFWEPGQGHLPVYIIECVTGGADGLGELHLAGRDLLSLKISAANAAKYGIRTHIHHLPAITSLPQCIDEGKIGFILANYTPIPGVREEEAYRHAAESLLAPAGTAAFSGKSSDIHRLTAKRRKYRITADRKFRGFRCILVRTVSSS